MNRQHYTPDPKRVPFWVHAIFAAGIGIGWAYFLVTYL
jgi:hypothetical protein